MKLRTGAAQRPRLGETHCGDGFAVFGHEVSNVVVVDGLGHGPEAAHAARAFLQVAASMPGSSPLDILACAGQALLHTRGAAALVTRFDCCARTLLVAGVGNVELRAIAHHPMQPLSVPGIVGRPTRPVREYSFGIRPGDLIVIMTDGISRRADLAAVADDDPQRMAERILREYGCDHDDATCVVVRVEAP